MHLRGDTVTGQFYIVLNQVLVFGILMLIGFVMAKVKVLTQDVLNGLSKLIVQLLLTCMVFHLIIGNGITIDHLIANRTYALGALLFFAVLCILGYAMAGACHMHAMGRDMFAVCTMFCNSGFMGIPLVTAMFGGNSQVMACFTLYIAMDQILLWTVGLLLCTWHVKRRNKASFGNLINPMLIAIIIAMALLYFGISLPRPVLNTIQGLGDSSRYLALLYLGALLAYKPVLSMLLKPHVYLLIVFKMTILPLGVYFFADLFFSSGVALLMATITSLPPMVATTMMARTYGGDETVAAESVFLATIACLVTIPIVQWLIAFIW